MTKTFAALALLLLAACGSRQPLEPAPGQALPPKPAMASSAQTSEELLTVLTVARPERVDEPLKRSEPREDDRFDLPPPE